MLVALGAVSVTSLLLHSIVNSIRDSQCSPLDCKRETSISTQETLSNFVPISQCQTTSLLLMRGIGRSLRDKIFLIGKRNSVSEYILPVMHLSKYDPTLVDSSYVRRGLSAVKYGYPITIASSTLRLALFNLGLADAIILSQEKIVSPIDPLAIKYRFRLQPFKIRQNLPRMTQDLGISEDSEAVESHVKRNPSLFDQSSYSCL